MGLDSSEWVFSNAMNRLVRNVHVDLTQLTLTQMIEKAEEDMSRSTCRKVILSVGLLAMTPCCRTFSKTDSCNVSRDNNFRLHGPGNPERDPKDGGLGAIDGSPKGQEAIDADRMVRHGIRVAKEAHSMGIPFYMENPVGSLVRRPYMVEWEKVEWLTRHTVHYCAYGHFYHKPTHIWTNMGGWVQKGLTSTGLCSQKCLQGYLDLVTRKWVHFFKMSRESHLAQGGPGRWAKKNMMPAPLHQELLTSAGKYQGCGGEQVDGEML